MFSCSKLGKRKFFFYTLAIQHAFVRPVEPFEFHWTELNWEQNVWRSYRDGDAFPFISFMLSVTRFRMRISRLTDIQISAGESEEPYWDVTVISSRSGLTECCLSITRPVVCPVLVIVRADLTSRPAGWCHSCWSHVVSPEGCVAHTQETPVFAAAVATGIDEVKSTSGPALITPNSSDTCRKQH